MRREIPKGKPRKLWPNVYVAEVPEPASDAAEEGGGESLFRRNVAVIALLHALAIAGLFLWANWHRDPPPQKVVWLDGGALAGEANGEPGAGSPAPASVASAPEKAPPPEPEPLPEPLPPPPEPLEPSALPPPPPSDLIIPKATPPPATPRPATPRPATPHPTTLKPKPKATPRATPKATPKPAPKATPRPTPHPKPKATPKPDSDDADKVDKDKDKDKDDAETQKAATATAKTKATPGKTKGSGTASTHGGKGGDAGTNGSGPGAGTGKGTGAGGTSEFGWYLSMIHDRFTHEWEQPTSVVRSSAGFVTRLKIRIAKDGTILSREITASSGNTVVDDSVMAAAQKVTQIESVPNGLTTGDTYEVAIDFKLDQSN